MICGVHLTTESSDHYNFCFQAESTEGLFELIQSELGDELAYVSEIWATPLEACDEFDEQKLYKLIDKARGEVNDDEDDGRDE